MTNKKLLAGILGILLVFGLAVAGCSSTTGSVRKVGWSNYTGIPSKDYTVAGVIILRVSDTKTLNADLMAEAVKLGADDIINIRVDVEIDDKGKQQIVAATAVAIKYAESLTSSTSITTDKTNVIEKSPVMGAGGGSVGESDESTEGKKPGLFGWGFLFL
jgi:uncharacterized protein YbjQ (UPF0145 family)